jgi:hypothetical protein
MPCPCPCSAHPVPTCHCVPPRAQAASRFPLACCTTRLSPHSVSACPSCSVARLRSHSAPPPIHCTARSVLLRGCVPSPCVTRLAPSRLAPSSRLLPRPSPTAFPCASSMHPSRLSPTPVPVLSAPAPCPRPRGRTHPVPPRRCIDSARVFRPVPTPLLCPLAVCCSSRPIPSHAGRLPCPSSAGASRPVSPRCCRALFPFRHTSHTPPALSPCPPLRQRAHLFKAILPCPPIPAPRHACHTPAAPHHCPLLMQAVGL